MFFESVEFLFVFFIVCRSLFVFGGKVIYIVLGLGGVGEVLFLAVEWWRVRR